MAFPRADITNLLADLFAEGTAIRWQGEPAQVNGSANVEVVIKMGPGRGKGTSEIKRTWDDGKQCYSTDITESKVWSIVIDVESYDADNRAEDVLDEVRLMLRWPSSIAAIQCAGLTTVSIGDVIPSIRYDGDDHECFGATLELILGQRLTSHVSNDDGAVIETVQKFTGTLTDGVPDPTIIDP